MKRMPIFPPLLLLIAIVLLGFSFLGGSKVSQQLPQNRVDSFLPSVVMISDGEAIIGAGTVIDSDNGLVLTSKHLFLGKKQYKVQLQSGQKYPLQLMYNHETQDLSLLKVLPDDVFRKIPSAPVVTTQNSLHRGDIVTAFGAFPISGTVILSQGVISDMAQKITLPPLQKEQTLIQTDINTMNGFSGGPLVSVQGEVIGVNTAQLSQVRLSWGTPVTSDAVKKMSNILSAQ